MAKLFDENGDGIGNGGAPGGGGVTDPIPPSDGLPVPNGDRLPTEVPQGGYLKQRFANISLDGTPVEAVLIDPKVVQQTTSLANVSYRWRGLQPFDAGQYIFAVTAADGFALLIDGRPVIDEWVTGPNREESAIVNMPAGHSLITLEWFKGSGTKSIRMAFTKRAVATWVSCEDGDEHDGAPPDGWILTGDGCWKPPVESDPGDVNLSEIVQISPDPTLQVERAYILDSGVQLTPYLMNFFNRSTNMSVNVAMDGPSPVMFSQRSFELQPQEEKGIQVDFIQEEMNKLVEGLNLSNIVATITAGTITLPKDSDGDIEIGPPLGTEPEQLPVVPLDEPDTPPPSPTWCDASGTETVERDGVPPTSWVLRSDGCYVPPTISRPDVNLSATFVETAPKLVKGINIAQGSLAASIVGDDPNTWTWAWDLDVANQGAGTGDTALRFLLGRWVMTEADLRSLEDNGATSRIVEVVARKGTEVLRSRLKIVFDDPALAFVTPSEPDPIDRKTKIIRDISGLA